MSCFHVWIAVNETTLTRDSECFRTRSAATSMTRRHPERFPPESLRLVLKCRSGCPRWRCTPAAPGPVRSSRPRSSAARPSRPVDDVAPPGEAARRPAYGVFSRNPVHSPMRSPPRPGAAVPPLPEPRGCTIRAWPTRPSLAPLRAHPPGVPAAPGPVRSSRPRSSNMTTRLKPSVIAFLAALVAVPAAAASEVLTHLYAFDRGRYGVTLGNGLDASNEGAIEAMGDDLLLVRPKGGLVLIRPNGAVERLGGEVPTNAAELVATVPDDDAHRWVLRHFRVADILLREASPGSFDLYVTHHYFDGKCVRFRLSSTLVVRRTITSNPPPVAPRVFTWVRPSWRIVFDAGVCLSPVWLAAHQAGGKMLPDGPDHLLVIIGDHGRVGSSALMPPDQPVSNPPSGSFSASPSRPGRHASCPVVIATRKVWRGTWRATFGLRITARTGETSSTC